MSASARLTWLGHSTVLIELDGARVLTDPVLRRQVLLLRRRAPVAAGELRVDAALISHVHWDHLDLRSLEKLGRGVRLVLPRGAGGLVRRNGFEHVVELDPGEIVPVGSLEVRAIHAEHDIRWPRRADAPALGFVLRGTRTIYFAGDTDLFEGMRNLVDDLDVAVLPIGGWGPTVPPGHLDPERAAQALSLLRPRLAVPVHYGTYTPLGLRQRGRDLGAEFHLRASKLAPEVEVRVLPIGGSLEL